MLENRLQNQDLFSEDFSQELLLIKSDRRIEVVINYFSERIQIDPYSAYGMAHRVFILLGSIIQYDKQENFFYIFKRTHYNKDYGEVYLKKLIIAILDTLDLERSLINKCNLYESYKKYLKKCKAPGELDKIIKMLPLLLPDFSSSQFNQNKEMINIQNGIYNMKTGYIQPHSSSLFFDYVIDIPLISQLVLYGNTYCNVFYSFLLSTFQDLNIIDWILTYIGYCLTGETKEQIFVIFHGAGRNGKSTLIKLLKKIMGTLSATIPASTLLKKQNHNGINSDIALFKNVRFVEAQETEAHHQLSTSTVKLLTGDDAITARKLYENYSTFKNEAKICLVTNNLPIIQNRDFAISRRIRVVPFDKIIREEEVDYDLDSKLEKELPAIFSVLLLHANKWYKDGLPHCPQIIKATNNYLQTRISWEDSLTDIIEQQPGAKVKVHDIFKKLNNLNTFNLSYKQLVSELRIKYVLRKFSEGVCLMNYTLKQ